VDRAGFELLAAEHALLRAQLERVVATPGGEGGGDRRRAREIRSLSAGMRKHLAREDRVLYPLCARLFGDRGGPVDVLRTDHRVLRVKLAAIERALGTPSHIMLPGLLSDLAGIVARHFGQEENILFPIAAARLSETEATFVEDRLRGPARSGSPRK
jgi:iron-sulfur cluster repair protein YtfE (RIC family)